MQNIFIQYRNLYNKSQDVLTFFEDLKDHDIRRKFFEILGSQILFCNLNLQVHEELYNNNVNIFNKIFRNDEKSENQYLSSLFQNLDESTMDTTLFQSELVFRSYYSTIAKTTPGSEKNLHKVIATIFEDTENNWKKEECKLLILLWTLRNTIHTGGIYFANVNGISHTYKGDEYKFEYAKHPKFLKDGFILNLLFELLESLKTLLSSDKINKLGYIEHPAFFAVV